MKLHRFFIDPSVELTQDLWLHEARIVHQLGKVLRAKPGTQIVLFDGQLNEKLYEIIEIKPDEIHITHKTDLDQKRPGKDVYLFWSLLKKDKNEWILQKCTELGVSHFIPLLADRSEKTGFNIERAHKIILEAAEQCGRSDIPSVREPMHIQTVIEQYQPKLDLYICQQADSNLDEQFNTKCGVLIGPEGGWSNAEKSLFVQKSFRHINLHDFTLRAETACVVAAAKLLQ